MSLSLRSLRQITTISKASTSRLTQRTFQTSTPARQQFLNADEEAFQKRVQDATIDKPILVDFFATWCQPCRLLTPVLKNLTGEDSKFDLMTIDVDAFPELAGQYKVSALPTVVAFKNGEKHSNFVGVLREEKIKAFMEKVIA